MDEILLAHPDPARVPEGWLARELVEAFRARG